MEEEAYAYRCDESEIIYSNKQRQHHHRHLLTKFGFELIQEFLFREETSLIKVIIPAALLPILLFQRFALCSGRSEARDLSKSIGIVDIQMCQVDLSPCGSASLPRRSGDSPSALLKLIPHSFRMEIAYRGRKRGSRISVPATALSSAFNTFLSAGRRSNHLNFYLFRFM